MSEFDGYITEHDAILQNKLGVNDPEEMKRIEADIVSIRMAELLSEPPTAQMDFDALMSIHLRLFGDLYDMAGKIRTVDIAKGGSAFCYAHFIKIEGKRIFAEMQRRMGSEHAFELDEMAVQLAWLASELNALHPFREGNGRAIRVFLMLLAHKYGFVLDYTSVPTEERLQADIEAFHGDLRKLDRLYRVMLRTA